MKMLSAFFLANFNINDKTITLDEKESHHAISVRRIKPGEEMYVTNGKGLIAKSQYDSVNKNLEVNVDEIISVAKPSIEITVVQALLKGERSDFAVELMTEVGVSQVVFWPAERSVARIENKIEKVLQRWNQLAIAATKQSRQAWLPQISYLDNFSKVVQLITQHKDSFLLDFEAKENLAFVAKRSKVLFVVGPEGGLSTKEKNDLMDVGAKAVKVGDSVLRGSTAGAVAAAVTLNLVGSDNE